jgi:hypothetical protein
MTDRGIPQINWKGMGSEQPSARDQKVLVRIGVALMSITVVGTIIVLVRIGGAGMVIGLVFIGLVVGGMVSPWVVRRIPKP